ncbi:MAG TPA: GNAT family N-acetyltransferase [Candidatus Baltobacteraceae bacterium]|nr:GNAT family N-acetyltransferase [Candidatus Baltobacteraceae bacterium]
MIDCGICILRPWTDGDVEPLAALADDGEVVRYLRDRFPHPYTHDDARAWIAYNRDRTPVEHFAIEADGEMVGGIAGERLEHEHRGTIRVGYWLGRRFFGRGLATAACSTLSEHLLATTDALRLEAAVYHPNLASMRVLEKSGYTCEGILRRSVMKGDRVYDAHVYAMVRS